jgi:uncharacterized protein YqfB (UPF0267 family)
MLDAAIYPHKNKVYVIDFAKPDATFQKETPPK